MLSLAEVIDKLNDKKLEPSDDVIRWRKVYYGMSLHIDGIVPAYQYLRNPGGAWISTNLKEIQPAGWGGAEYQFLFDNRLLNRHPRESELTRQWRMSQYKPFTKQPFGKVIQVITGGIFQDSNYSILLENEEDQDFIWGENFGDRKNLPGFIADEFQVIASDPNGYFVVRPKKSRKDYLTEGGKVEPEIIAVPTKHILIKTPDELIWKEGETVWLVNAVGYFRFVKKDGEFVNIDGDGDGYYTHGFNQLPAVVNGGNWNNQGFYDSWLDAAKAIADEFVSAKSAEQLVNREASHPFIIETSEDCPSCDGGQVQWCNKCHVAATSCACGDPVNYQITSCGDCGGKGTISRNPGERLLVPYEEMDRDSIKLINPDISINKFHVENNAALMRDMMGALHLQVVEEAQSGAAKDKDMETRYQFLSLISNDLFDRVIPQLIYFITGLRNVTAAGQGGVIPAPVKVTITKPTQFDIKTAQDLLEEFKTASEAKVPSFLLKKQMEDYVDKQFGGDDILKKKTSFINQSDFLSVTSVADIQAMLLFGATDQRQVQYHFALPAILDRLIRVKSSDWFKAADFEAIDKEVQTLFEQAYPPLISINEPSPQTDVL